jgi:uncharacterized membrane protein
MTDAAHLWAVGFDEMERADQVRKLFVGLSDKQDLILLDSVVVVRYLDGLLTLDGEPFVTVNDLDRHNFASFLAGLALFAPPLTSAAAGTLQRSTHAVTTAAVGISDDFVSEVERQIKPGTSALFVLDQAGDLDAILQKIRGLGGTVLKTSVDLERAKLIQATLAAAATDAKIDLPPGHRLDDKTENPP